ncbi:SAVMC3_10250 family protein [Glycomyces sp. YM15]|uniref:DUF7019 family protein n=1 Tax=Glycomyces sp. YM15 TaxID=2800446 RepID=UPI001962BF1A|nr:SAVMC3_10250 family protein [Glycomyces sp. YM15]
MFRRKKPPLRYFLYVSDSKLDMLFDQIDPAQRRRISIDVGVNLKVASLNLRQGNRSAVARMAKLRMVERYIDLHHQVGTVYNPGTDYFRGAMPMRWGWFGHGLDPDSPTDGHDTVFFRGDLKNHTVVLAGSRRHVLGEEPAAENRRLTSWSATPNIMAVIAEHISANPPLGKLWRRLRASDFKGSEAAAAAHDPLEVGLEWATVVKLSGPLQWVEFLAVPLVQGNVTDHTSRDEHPGGPKWTPAILATPLYVALATQDDPDP